MKANFGEQRKRVDAVVEARRGTSATPPQKAEIESTLRLVRAYWLKTIHPHIKGRRLQGVELFVAADAHRRLESVQRRAEDWNRTVYGVCDPIAVAPLAADESYREPEELCRDENLKPETLASIAATLTSSRAAELSPVEAVRHAHELLLVAQGYLNSLPEKKRGIERLLEDFSMAFSPVTFAKIEASNGQLSGTVPLLPPVQYASDRGGCGKRGNPERLSLVAIRSAVKKFFEQKKAAQPEISEEQWNSQNERMREIIKTGQIIPIGSAEPQSYDEWKRGLDGQMKDAMKNSWISLQYLCELRWTRFEEFWQKQGRRARNRKTSKNT